MMEFIKDLQESRMTRDSHNMRVLTYSDCCERAYLILLALEIMRHYPKYSDRVRRYARFSRSDYRKYKIESTDLHNLIYFIQGDEVALSKLKDPGAARRQQARSAFPIRDVADYLAKLTNGNGIHFTQQMFIRLENGLQISNKDYKELRRYLSNYTSQSKPVQENVVTKLLFALRAKLRNSDIIDDFSELVVRKDLESDTVKDTEQTPSIPDISANLEDVKFYRLLINPSKLILIKNFLSLIRDNKVPPLSFIQAYIPIIQMVHDIVQAGPTYINMLKTLHNRAKQAR